MEVNLIWKSFMDYNSAHRFVPHPRFEVFLNIMSLNDQVWFVTLDSNLY